MCVCENDRDAQRKQEMERKNQKRKAQAHSHIVALLPCVYICIYMYPHATPLKKGAAAERMEKVRRVHIRRCMLVLVRRHYHHDNIASLSRIFSTVAPRGYENVAIYRLFAGLCFIPIAQNGKKSLTHE